MCLTCSSRQKHHHRKCAEKMVASLASPPSRKVRFFVQKKRERKAKKMKEDSRPKKIQKIKRNILVHPSICFLVAHIDELTCRSRPCHPRNHGNRFNGSAEMAILVGGFLTTLHSWRDGDVLVAQLPKSASPSGHLLQFANWKPWQAMA